jgi:hypothetical protein
MYNLSSYNYIKINFIVVYKLFLVKHMPDFAPFIRMGRNIILWNNGYFLIIP